MGCGAARGVKVESRNFMVGWDQSDSVQVRVGTHSCEQGCAFLSQGGPACDEVR